MAIRSRRTSIEDGYGESPPPMPLRGAYVAKRGGNVTHVWPIIDFKFGRLGAVLGRFGVTSWAALGFFGLSRGLLGLIRSALGPSEPLIGGAHRRRSKGTRERGLNLD